MISVAWSRTCSCCRTCTPHRSCSPPTGTCLHERRGGMGRDGEVTGARMAKFRRLGEGCEIQRSRVAGAGHAPAGAAFGAPPFCPPLGLPNRFWNISRGLSWMAWVCAGICDASALTWICVVSNGRITASTISVIKKCRNKQWIGRAPAARAIKGRTVRPPSHRRPCPRGWRHAASPRAHERRPESRLGRADPRPRLDPSGDVDALIFARGALFARRRRTNAAMGPPPLPRATIPHPSSANSPMSR